MERAKNRERKKERKVLKCMIDRKYLENIVEVELDGLDIGQWA